MLLPIPTIIATTIITTIAIRNINNGNL